MGALTGFATIWLVVALGWLLAHTRALGSSGQSMLNKLAFVAASPALLFDLVAHGSLSHLFSRSLAASALAIAGTIGLVEAGGVLATVPRRVEWLLTVVNALMMSVYLWHIGAIAIAAGVLLGVGLAVPAASGVALAQPTVAALTLVIVVALVPQIGRLEARLIAPLGASPDTLRAVLAYVVLVAGTVLVWQTGTVLHPASPVSTAGVLLVWLGVWLMRKAAGARPRPSNRGADDEAAAGAGARGPGGRRWRPGTTRPRR